jgi:CRP-like cAMP-binding protein
VLGDKRRQSLIDSIQEEQYKKGETVIKENEKGDKFYFVEKGEAKAVKNIGRNRLSRGEAG